jgi:hypothetical protein
MCVLLKSIAYRPQTCTEVEVAQPKRILGSGSFWERSLTEFIQRSRGVRDDKSLGLVMISEELFLIVTEPLRKVAEDAKEPDGISTEGRNQTAATWLRQEKKLRLRARHTVSQ